MASFVSRTLKTPKRAFLLMLLSFNHPNNPSHGKGGVEPVLASCANHLVESCRIYETIEKRTLDESADQIRVL
jgi:hypothetical protein